MSKVLPRALARAARQLAADDTRGRLRRLGLAASAVLVLVVPTTLASAALQSGTATSAEANLVGEWHLDEGARCDDSTSSTPDSSGNGHTATVLNACSAPGKVGTAFKFPAGWVAANGAKLRPLSAVSVRAWVRADGSPGPSRYVLAQGSGACTPAAYGMYTSFAGDANAGGLYFYVTLGGRAYHSPGLAPARIWDGKWHQVMGTFDGARVHLFLDGTEVGSGTSTPSGFIDYSQPSPSFVIGSYGKPYGTACAPGVPSVSFRGEIDEVQVFDVALGSNSPPVSDVGSAAPILRTTGVDQITESSARVNGTVDNQQTVQASPYQIEYGKTTAYGQKTPIQNLPATAAAAGVNQVSVTLTGLEPDTDYNARLVSPWSTIPGQNVRFHTAGRAKPTTTISLDPAQPTAAGFYQGFVDVRVTASGRGALETRCVLDPDKAPASFADLPARCEYSGGRRVTAPGSHVLYAATRDAAGLTEAPPVSRTFQISYLPDTTITSGPRGETWRPNNLFYFTASEQPATFECRVDNGPFQPCSSPFETGVLGPGTHTFEVRAIAPGGAADPTPADAKFSVAAPTSARADCTVQPVRYWLITGWERGWSSVDQNDKSVCEIGTPGKEACTHVTNCVVKVQRCPVGARCTITTKAAWFDADTAINWGVSAVATVGRFIPTSGGLTPTVTSLIRQAPEAIARCETGFTGDRCYTQATLQVLGGSNVALLSVCQMVLGGRALGYNFPSTASVRAVLGPDTIRRIECNADWRVEPAPELAAVPAGRLVDVNTIAAGVLSILPSIIGSTTDRATASTRDAMSGAAHSEAKPKIAAVRKVVGKAGPVRIRLELNAAARRLLTKRKQLTVRLRLTFVAKGRKPVVRTQHVTIAMPRTDRRCAVPEPAPGARPGSVKLPACMARAK